MSAQEIPNIVVSRLPLYLRALQRMAELGVKTTSSQELGERVGITAAQIRKDLSLFGEFGKQGTGYYIPFLVEELRRILHVDEFWDVVVVGMGDIGHAVTRYQGFKSCGFRIVMVFDSDPARIGEKVGNYVIQDVKEIGAAVKAAKVQIAMLAVPAEAAQAVTDQLVAAGVKAILNYAPISLTVPADVRVQYIDPAIGLQRMTYYLGRE
jgi:redox-sensing transcriptional repressor